MKNSKFIEIPATPASLVDEDLLPEAARLKSQLEHIPLWRGKGERSGNGFWNALAGSHVNLCRDDND